MKILGKVKIEVIITEKDNKIFFIPKGLDCTYRNSCENCDLMNHCKFLELFSIVNKKLDKKIKIWYIEKNKEIWYKSNLENEIDKHVENSLIDFQDCCLDYLS